MTDTQCEIADYLASLAEPKRAEMTGLHNSILQWLPGCKLWFSNGTNDQGKVVSNPSIGYGSYLITYADGTTKEFFPIGLSANQTGISVYIMGIPDKNYLSNTYCARIGKAKVTGYCIKFKSVADINRDILGEAIKDRIAHI